MIKTIPPQVCGGIVLLLKQYSEQFVKILIQVTPWEFMVRGVISVSGKAVDGDYGIAADMLERHPAIESHIAVIRIDPANNDIVLYHLDLLLRVAKSPFISWPISCFGNFDIYLFFTNKKIKAIGVSYPVYFTVNRIRNMSEVKYLLKSELADTAEYSVFTALLFINAESVVKSGIHHTVSSVLSQREYCVVVSK